MCLEVRKMNEFKYCVDNNFYNYRHMPDIKKPTMKEVKENTIYKIVDTVLTYIEEKKYLETGYTFGFPESFTPIFYTGNDYIDINYNYDKLLNTDSDLITWIEEEIIFIYLKKCNIIYPYTVDRKQRKIFKTITMLDEDFEEKYIQPKTFFQKNVKLKNEHFIKYIKESNAKISKKNDIELYMLSELL